MLGGREVGTVVRGLVALTGVVVDLNGVEVFLPEVKLLVVQLVGERLSSVVLLDVGDDLNEGIRKR